MFDENAQKDLTLKAEIDLYYDLLVPEHVGKRAPLLIAVHGYGAHKNYMMREARLVAPKDWVIVSVQGPHQHFRKTDDGYRIGYGWLTDSRPEEYVKLHHKFLLDIINKLKDDDTIDPSRVHLYGFSQACALNFRFAFTHPDAVKSVVGVCGGIPGDLATSELYKPFGGDVLYLFGDDDEFYTQEKFDEYDQALASRLPSYSSKRYQAKHEISQEMRVDIKRYFNARR